MISLGPLLGQSRMLGIMIVDGIGCGSRGGYGHCDSGQKITHYNVDAGHKYGAKSGR